VADGANSEWVVQVHREPPVIEVVYPQRPGPGADDRYEDAVRAAVAQFKGAPFDVLVDQRAMPVLPPALSDRVAGLSAWAMTQGLRAMVRVVRRSAIAELQARKVIRDAGFSDDGKVIFYSVEDAWAHLRGGGGSAVASTR
jgi:hypothetical protein